ncbi:MAG: Gx transporter family protein [Oscillospiraceae bacterium]|nr:Gx transporter family protein [Oscillospiraceae bacterium]
MRNQKTRTVAFMGLLVALAITLSYIEALVPSFIPVPGVKLGLSNIATMYCLFFVGAPSALLLAVLKSAFVLLTRGVTAGALSLAGGLLSVGVMALATALHASKGLASVAGAVFHNLGQLAAAYLLLRTATVLYYAPVLILSGVVMGVLTASALRLLLPALQRIRGQNGNK